MSIKIPSSTHGSCDNSSVERHPPERVSRTYEDDFFKFCGEQSDDPEGCQRPTQLDTAIQEITIVHDQLKKHSARLHSWDAALRTRERAVDDIVRNSDMRINSEVERRFKRGKEQYEKEISLLESQLKEKTIENQRLQSSLNNIRESYAKVKAEKEKLQESCSQLQRKNHALEGRLRNLKRIPSKPESLTSDAVVSLDSNREPPSNVGKTRVADSSAKAKTVTSKSGLDKNVELVKGPLSTIAKELVVWFNEVQLQPLFNAAYGYDTKKKESLGFLQSQSLDRCLLILPRITDLLFVHFNKHNPLQLEDSLFFHCLKFLHFSFLLLDQVECGKKRKVAASLHRLGETIHQQLLLPSNQVEPVSLRMCTCFVVIHTVAQIDTVLHTWKLLKSQLNNPQGRQCFTSLFGHVFILSLIANHEPQFVSKQMSRALDLLLCLTVDDDSIESNELHKVLISPAFIGVFCQLLKGNSSSESHLQTETKEKLVVLMQQGLKRPLDDVTCRVISENKLPQVLQKEVSNCMAKDDDSVTAYELVLKTTLALLSPFQSRI